MLLLLLLLLLLQLLLTTTIVAILVASRSPGDSRAAAVTRMGSVAPDATDLLFLNLYGNTEYTCGFVFGFD